MLEIVKFGKIPVIFYFQQWHKSLATLHWFEVSLALAIGYPPIKESN